MNADKGNMPEDPQNNNPGDVNKPQEDKPANGENQNMLNPDEADEMDSGKTLEENTTGQKLSKFTVYCEIRTNWITQIKNKKELLGKEPMAQLTGNQ